MSATKPKPKTVRELDLLCYADKVRHWNREDDPWKPDEGAYRFKNPEFESLRLRQVDGNVVAMVELIGRPCFGIPTAFLRYHNATKFVRGRGQLPGSRCGGCKIFDVCKRLVDARLNRGHPEVKAAHDEWLLAGGIAGFNEPRWRELNVGRMWRKLVRTLVDYPYESCNDEAVADDYRRGDEKALEDDRRRKKRERDAKLKAGDPDPQHLEDVRRAANARLERVVRAVKHAREQSGDKRLSQLSRQSLIDLHSVWMGRQLLLLQGRRANAAEIARWIVATGRRHDNVNANALATRVRKDLRRIDDFEQMVFEGRELISAFDRPSELSA